MAAWLKGQFDFWVSSEFFAVGLSAFLGVYIRVAIEDYFNSASYSGNHGWLGTLFYSNTYLVPNFIGCFIMSVCVANMKAITDVSAPLYKFLTTGLCGCITTYSSWLNGTIFRSLEANDVYGMLVQLLFEFWLTWGAFTCGFTFSKLCVEFWEWAFPKPKEAPAPAVAEPAPAAAPPILPPPPEATSAASQLTADKTGPGKPEMNGSSAVSTVSPLQPAPKEKASKRTSVVRFQESDDDMRMLSDDEANALEEESARQNTAANSGPVRPGRASTFGRVSAFGPINSRNSTHNIRSSTVTFGNARSSTGGPGIRGSTVAGGGDDTGRVSAWGRGSLAPRQYDRNSLFAVQEDIVLNYLAGRISVWREDGVLEGDQADNRRSLAYRARNSTVSRKSRVGRTASNPGTEMSPASTPPASESQNADPEIALPANGSDTSEADKKDDTPFIKFVLFCIRNEYTIWSTLFCVVAVILWSILGVGRDLTYFNNDVNRNLFRSVCLAPFGAWVRWAPTRLPWIKAYWPVMNPQTFMVNQLAVLLMACFVVFLPAYSWTPGFDNGKHLYCKRGRGTI
jgi:fluoride ion exporter CrcB/FEX